MLIHLTTSFVFVMLMGAASSSPLANPSLDVLDIAAMADIAPAASVPLLVDSTLTTPWSIQPLLHGADLVQHVATQFLSGHGADIGGVVVDGGRFDWERAHARGGRFAERTEPYAGFPGMVFCQESTVGAFALRRLHPPSPRWCSSTALATTTVCGFGKAAILRTMALYRVGYRSALALGFTGSTKALMQHVLASHLQVNIFHRGFVACDRYQQGEAAARLPTRPREMGA